MFSNIKYLEENEPQKMVGYNKSNHEDPTEQYVALDLFDLFFLYVMAASKKSSDSKLSNMRSGPWNDIKVEEMIEDFLDTMTEETKEEMTEEKTEETTEEKTEERAAERRGTV
jgi:lipoate-protein ligase A